MDFGRRLGLDHNRRSEYGNSHHEAKLRDRPSHGLFHQGCHDRAHMPGLPNATVSGARSASALLRSWAAQKSLLRK